MLIQTHALPLAALCDLWAAVHRNLLLTIGRAERHYLRTVALTIDDDVVSGLLLRKLRTAHIAADAALPASVVRMNSLVEYRVGTDLPRRRRLVHSAGCASGELGITTSEGAALIGLTAGQALLWPSSGGELHEVRVLGVDGQIGADAC